MNKGLSDITSIIKASLGFLDNPFIKFLIVIILIVYVSAVSPTLNKDVSKVFDNLFVRLLLVLIIAYISVKDPTIAILLVLAFAISTQTAAKHNVQTLGNSLYQTSPPTFETLERKTSYNDTSDANPDPVLDLPDVSKQQINQDMQDAAPGPGVGEGVSDTGSFDNVAEPLDPNGPDNSPRGYSNDVDCLASCGANEDGSSPLSAPCTGIATWKNELNAQGFNYPMGFPGTAVGSTF